jgi:hypothetical protein
VLPTAARYTASYEKAGQEAKEVVGVASKNGSSSKKKTSNSRDTIVITLPEPGLDEEQQELTGMR